MHSIYRYLLKDFEFHLPIVGIQVIQSNHHHGIFSTSILLSIDSFRLINNLAWWKDEFHVWNHICLLDLPFGKWEKGNCARYKQFPYRKAVMAWNKSSNFHTKNCHWLNILSKTRLHTAKQTAFGEKKTVVIWRSSHRTEKQAILWN